MLFQSALLMAALATGVLSQTNANSSIDPSSVDPTMRGKPQWCQGQSNTCGTLCGGDLEANECNPDNLIFSCKCASNHSAPGLQYYKETMPTFICEKIFDNCIKAGENSQAAQQLCTTNERANCGHLSPENFTSSAPSQSSSASSTTAGEAGASATSNKESGAVSTIVPVRNFGTGALVIGVAAAIGLLS
ncbi:BgTH12-03173 [Blumeria graminis f. sp. triticale]|uniref:Bgt-3821 n=3 Tax=Blumeria graminis TaxID=34373 RepID=A0A061HHC4_BLUGR|nr:hypothetical protein BGT96224_3821 [Blumeria graminis f. sp. tritici 96224]CAD6503511.1 BgTH12-03173 [Blumeria graminis f. sp. triticale]VDB89613.1 Bgt-3821 [Blumeria graminis f. sp. tritici]